MAIENDEIGQGLETGLCELKDLLHDFALRKIDKPQILAEVSIQKEILNFLELYMHVLESPAKKALIKLNIIGESISDVTQLERNQGGFPPTFGIESSIGILSFPVQSGPSASGLGRYTETLE